MGGSCADSRLAAWRDPKPVIRVREATPAVLSPRARLTKLLTGRAGVGRSVRRERQAPPGRPRRDRQRGPTVQFAVLGIISRRGRGAGRGVTFRSESEDDWVGDAGPPPMENIFLPEIFCHPRPRPSEGGGRRQGGSVPPLLPLVVRLGLVGWCFASLPVGSVGAVCVWCMWVPRNTSLGGILGRAVPPDV